MSRIITAGTIRTEADALHYITDCTLATVESFPKSGAKSEYKRQIAIAQIGIDNLRRFNAEFATRSRPEDVVAKFDGSVEAWAKVNSHRGGV